MIICIERWLILYLQVPFSNWKSPKSNLLNPFTVFHYLSLVSLLQAFSLILCLCISLSLFLVIIFFAKTISLSISPFLFIPEAISAIQFDSLCLILSNLIESSIIKNYQGLYRRPQDNCTQKYNFRFLEPKQKRCVLSQGSLYQMTYVAHAWRKIEMVLILDGTSEKGAYVRSNLCYLIS